MAKLSNSNFSPETQSGIYARIEKRVNRDFAVKYERVAPHLFIRKLICLLFAK